VDADPVVFKTFGQIRIWDKILSDPVPGSSGSEMNIKLIKFTISQLNVLFKKSYLKQKSP
jgi:hypothetical protein